MRKSFSKKVYTTNFIVIFLVFISSIYSILMINKTQQYANDTGAYWIPIIENSQKLVETLSQINLNAVLLVNEKEQKNAEKILRSIETDVDKVTELSNKFDTLFSKEGQKILYSDFDEKWKRILAAKNTLTFLMKDEKFVESKEHLNQKLIPLLQESQKIFSGIIELSYASGKESTKQGEYLGQVTMVTMAIIFVLSLLASVVTIRIIRSTSKKLVDSVEILKSQAVLCSSMGTFLKENSEYFAASIDEQAVFVKKTKGIIDEITGILANSEENVNVSIGIIEKSSYEAETGERIMQNFVDSMNDIQESSVQLKDIASIISQIEMKTDVINEIVAKTELLSLNAAIESARAAQYGKGFAVVAEEVGNLAKISGNSANEIQQLIQSSQEQVEGIIFSTQEKVNKGRQITNDAQNNFSRILQNISSVHFSIGKIINSTKKQENEMKKICASVEEITKDTVKNQDTIQSNKQLAMDLVEQSKKIDTLAQEIEDLLMGINKAKTA